VKGEGDFSIVSVKSQLNFLEETKRKDTIVVLETEKEKLATRLLRINAELLVLDRQDDLLSRNRVQVLGLLNNPSKVEDMKSLMDFQKGTLSEILTKKLDLEAELKKINQNLGKINNQITELNGRTSTTTAEVVVTVFAKNAAISDAKFRLEYIVPNCGWTPYYDLRVKDVISPIVTQMKAKVRQNSGEDWREVKLTLSTGEPNKGGVKPELGIWKIGWDGRSYYQGRVMSILENYEESLKVGLKDKLQGIITDADGLPLVGAAIVIKGTTKGTITDIEGKYTLDVLPNERNSNLVVSYVGYNQEEVPIGNSAFSNVQLNENSMVLSEVVVVGYGTRDSDDSPSLPDTRSSATSSLKAQQMLQGKVSGVAGNSSKIRVRGNSSLNQNIIEVKENQKTTSTTFEIELPYTIPTDGKEYQVEIKEENIKAEYQYVCVPKLETDAFLTAQIVDWEQYNLLEGEANLYFEGTYMGKTLLKTNSVEDTLKLSLGRDKNVVVTRTKLKDFSKTSFLSSKIKASRGYEIKIRNKKSVAISIVIEDQIPIVSEKSIDVEYENKGAEYNKEQGKLTWKIELKPLEDKKVNFNYTVKYPNTVNVDLE
jgi:Domain of unknown function (DUF4139)